MASSSKKDSVRALFFIQIFATIGYAVLYSTLVLYATKKLGFSESQASITMGVFAAFNYGLHMFGGYLGGRFLSNRNLFVFGMILQVIGCFIISSQNLQGLYWGLSMFLTGAGLNVTCINMMLTQRFEATDHDREKAFLWNYAGMNLGFFAGFTGAGYFQLDEAYSTLFMFAIIGNVVAIIITLLKWKHLADLDTILTHATPKQHKKRLAIGIAILVALVPVIRNLLTHAGFTSYFVIVVSIVVFGWMCSLTIKHKHDDEQKRMSAFLILFVGSLVFWMLYQLAPMGLLLFTEHNINLDFGSFHFAPQWAQDINTVVIVVGGPVMSWLFNKLRHKGFNINIPTQFSLALFFMAAGMLVLPLGISFADENGIVGLKWILLCYFLQSIGELLISPIGYAMIGRLAPTKYQGIMMGCWMLGTGLGAVLAGKISGLMPVNTGSTPLLTNPGYSQVFIIVGVGSAVMGVIMYCLTPYLRKLIR